MSWNYRIVKRKTNKETWYAIYEAYYNKKGGIWAISSEPIYPSGETLDELKGDFELMKNAFDDKPLNYDRKFAKAPFDPIIVNKIKDEQE